MLNELIAIKYARALDGLSTDQNRDQNLLDLRNFTAFVEMSEVKSVMLSPAMPSALKSDLTEFAFKKLSTGESVQKFCKLLLSNGRMKYLFLIVEQFEKLVFQKKGSVRMELVTALPLKDEDTQSYRSILEKKLDKTVELSNRLDKEVLGGCVLRFDGKQMDLSIRRALSEITKAPSLL